jgi:uncharacterized protein (DUF488 family)
MDEHNIKELIDVRSKPYSRRPDKYEFNKNRFKIRLGDRYVWYGNELGGMPGPATEKGIEYLEKEESSGNVLILMCLENNPRNCHRFQDIGVRLLVRGIDIIHIHDGVEEKTSEIMKGVLL